LRLGRTPNRRYSNVEKHLRQPTCLTRVATAAMIGSLGSLSTISILSFADVVKRGPPAFSIAVRSRATKASGPAEVESLTV